jgi:hypothetical protein
MKEIKRISKHLHFRLISTLKIVGITTIISSPSLLLTEIYLLKSLKDQKYSTNKSNYPFSKSLSWEKY